MTMFGEEFRTIMMDPPWLERGGGQVKRGADRHYPLLPTPDDLRRTCATWLRADGASTDALAPLMGHADGRMVERVYGRLDPEQLRARLQREVGPASGQGDCITSASDSADASGFVGLNGREATGASEEVLGVTVPRGGIEPPTRGFSVPCRIWPTRRDSSRPNSTVKADASGLHQPSRCKGRGNDRNS